MFLSPPLSPAKGPDALGAKLIESIYALLNFVAIETESMLAAHA
jgi:hypothetical protein